MGGAGCGLSVWRVGRDRGEAESHSRAEDNVVGWRRGGEGRSVRCGACAGGVRTGWVCVCVWVDMCVCAVCRRGVCAGMRAMCRVPLRVWVWVWPVGARGHGGAETEAQRHS